MPDHLPTRRPRPLSSLTASARRIADRKIMRTLSEKWQDDAWNMYDEVAELRYVANSNANSTSRARMFAARLSAGEEEPTPVGAEDDSTYAERVAAQTVKSLGDGSVGRSEVIRRLAVQLFIAGDGYVVGLPRGAMAGAREPVGPEGVALADLEWHAMNVSEVATRSKSYLFKSGADEVAIPMDDAIVVRVWRPHPRRWWQADSPVRPSLPVLRELVGLTKHVGASIDSRLAGAGLLVLGQSVEVASATNDDGAGDSEGVDDFVEALMDTMTTPIRDRDSAAAVVPMTIKVPDDVVDKIQHLTFSTPFDDHAKDLRDEAIRRLALGLDAPPETLLGLGGANHWSAWQIEESTIKVHIEPVLSLICDALTTEYLWPVLQEAGVPDYDQFVVWFDTADLSMRPNKSGEAQALYAAGELSGEALRRETGFGPDDAPTGDPAVQMALRMVQDNPALMADPGLPQMVETLRQYFTEDTDVTLTADQVNAELDTGGLGTPDTLGDAPDLDVTASVSIPRGR